MNIQRQFLKSALIIAISSYSIFTYAFSPKLEVGVFISDTNDIHFDYLKKNKEFIIDHKSSKGYELYGPFGLKVYLKTMSIPFTELIENPAQNKSASWYPSPKQIENKLKKMAKENPKIMKLYSIGQSERKRDLWVIKLSDNVSTDEVEPEVKYIANMHGNEIVGRELMLLLVQDLLKAYKNGDPRVRNLINNNEVFILPSMNPDGAAKRSRANSRRVDLNRDFPDFTTRDNSNKPQGRAAETKAVMAFQARRHFSLSANFHGGTKVVNYPWDTKAETFPMFEHITQISLEYASENQDMRNSSQFKDGIVNGYEWYEVDGGMQDWSYYWYGDLQVTVELSYLKWPEYTRMHEFYNDNREALVKYLERVNGGAGFVSRDKSLHGNIDIYKINGKSKRKIGSYPFSRGEYYKVLSDGNYEFIITSNKNKKRFQTRVVFSHSKKNGNYTSLDLL